jgi:transposase InsO family protein
VANEELKRRIKAIYEQSKKILGYRRIQDELFRQHRLTVNHKRVLRLMQELGIRSIIRRKYSYRSSRDAAISDGRIAENRLQRDFKANGSNQKWVTDVIQHRVCNDRICLSAIKDLWNGEIIAYYISNRNDNPLVLETFNKAFAKHKDVSGLIVHSDQEASTRPMHTMTCCPRPMHTMTCCPRPMHTMTCCRRLAPNDIRSIEEAQSSSALITKIGLKEN